MTKCFPSAIIKKTGCLISLLPFNKALEILIRAIRQEKKKNIQIRREEIKLFLFENDMIVSISSVQFSCSFVSDSLQAHESQHARPPCPSPTPRVHSNSCPSIVSIEHPKELSIKVKIHKLDCTKKFWSFGFHKTLLREWKDKLHNWGKYLQTTYPTKN